MESKAATNRSDSSSQIVVRGKVWGNLDARTYHNHMAVTLLPIGCVSQDQRIFGTYLHGIFDHDAFRHVFLRASRAVLQMNAPADLIAWSERRREQLDLLADAFGRALNLDAIFGMVGLPPRGDRAERRFS